MLDGTKYIIEDNRQRKRKELPELAFFKKKNYKVILADQNLESSVSKLSVQSIPLDDININTSLFQNRKHHYSIESVERILDAVETGGFNWELFDPILLWQDENGKLWLLSGHSRTEAFKRLCRAGNNDFCSIPAKIIRNISKEKAIEIAKRSNTLSTKETDTERAKYYRDLRIAGKSSKEIAEECKKAEGRNCGFILRLTYLNPSGKLIRDYEVMEKGGGESNAILKSIVNWIGEARRKYPQLTDRHETELYEWLKTKYGRGAGLISNLTQFLDRLENILQKLGEPLPDRLNLVKYDTRSSFRKEYDERLQEAERELNAAKKRLENKRNELIRRGASQDKINRLLVNYNQEVNFWAEELLKRKGDLEKYLQAERRQTSLFGLGSLGISFDFFNTADIHDLNDLKKQYRKLALTYHPDKGGSDADMQKINEEYNFLFEKIISGQKLNDEELNIEVEVDEKYKEIIDKLTRFPGLNIEVIGSWIWISGNTYPIRKELKEIGFRFAGKKKMWYWHSQAYKKRTRKHFDIDELRKIYGSEKVNYEYRPTKELGAIEVLRQNKIKVADFKGYQPTYNRNLDFSQYIKRCKPAKIERKQGDLQTTIEYIKSAIAEHSCEVKELAKVLKGNTIEQTVFNVWHFLRPRSLGGQVNYHLDTPGVEEIRTPARSWDDRIKGVDCEDLAIFAGSILKNLGIPFNLRIVGFFGGKGYQHIFVEVPVRYKCNRPTKPIILDPVMKMKFNELPKNITANMEINYMSGVAGVTNPVMLAIERIAEQELSGLGSIDKQQVIETAKDIERLAEIKEAQQMLYFASVDDEYTNNLGKFSFRDAWNNLKDKADNLIDKLKDVPGNVRDTAKDVWDKARNGVQKGWDYYKKYGFAPVRGAFLVLLRVNFLGLAKKLYVGYISTQDAKKKYHLDPQEYSKARAARVKFENFWRSMGGNVDALKRAVTEGRAKKKFEKGLPKASGVRGLGVTGVDDAAAVTAAATTTAPFWARIIAWFKNIKWDKLFKAFDKIAPYIPHGRPKPPVDMPDLPDTSKDKISSSGGDTDDKGIPKWILPVAAGSVIASIFLFN